MTFIFLCPIPVKHFFKIWIFSYKLPSLLNYWYIWTGEEHSKQVTLVLNENREMMDSFTVISLELSTLAKNLKAAEDQRERQKKVCYMNSQVWGC